MISEGHAAALLYALTFLEKCHGIIVLFIKIGHSIREVGTKLQSWLYWGWMVCLWLCVKLKCKSELRFRDQSGSHCHSVLTNARNFIQSALIQKKFYPILWQFNSFRMKYVATILILSGSLIGLSYTYKKVDLLYIKIWWAMIINSLDYFSLDQKMGHYIFPQGCVKVIPFSISSIIW